MSNKYISKHCWWRWLYDFMSCFRFKYCQMNICLIKAAHVYRITFEGFSKPDSFQPRVVFHFNYFMFNKWTNTVFISKINKCMHMHIFIMFNHRFYPNNLVNQTNNIKTRTSLVVTIQLSPTWRATVQC